LGYVPRRLATRHAAAMAAHDPLPPLADQLLASLPGPTLSVVVRGQEDEQLLTPLYAPVRDSRCRRLAFNSTVR
jgi:hypothetical protein